MASTSSTATRRTTRSSRSGRRRACARRATSAAAASLVTPRARHAGGALARDAQAAQRAAPQARDEEGHAAGVHNVRRRELPATHARATCPRPRTSGSGGRRGSTGARAPTSGGGSSHESMLRLRAAPAPAVFHTTGMASQEVSAAVAGLVGVFIFFSFSGISDWILNSGRDLFQVMGRGFQGFLLLEGTHFLHL